MVLLKKLNPNYKPEEDEKVHCESGTCSVLKDKEEDADENQ